MYAWYMTFICAQGTKRFIFFRPTWLRSTSGTIVSSFVLGYISQSSYLSCVMDCKFVREGKRTLTTHILEPMQVSPSSVPFVRRGDILWSIRGITVLVWSAGVTRKGIRPANVDFAVLDVSREGKCHNAWCFAARVCFTNNRTSRRACRI